MKKSSPRDPGDPVPSPPGQRQSMLYPAMAGWAGWPLGLQLAAFWLAVAAGALLWGGSLWLAAGRPDPASLPGPLTAAYVLGLYAWLLLLCRLGGRALARPAPRLGLAGFVRGAGLGLAAIGLLFGLGLGLGWCELARPRPDWPLIGLQVGAMALALAWIEERLFRGLLLDLGRRRLGPEAALQLQAACYALVHLLRPLPLLAWIEALAALWLTGLLLGRLRQDDAGTTDLGASIGLHAAWIGTSSFCAWAGLLVWNPASSGFSGGGNPVYGWAGLLLVLGLERAAARLRRARRSDPAQTGSGTAEAGASSDAWRQDV